MTRQDLRLFLLGLVATLAIGGAGIALFLALTEPKPQAPQPEQQADVRSEPAPPPAPAPAAPAPAAAPDAQADSEAAAIRAGIEKAIGDAPDIARFFGRLRLVLPGDYEAAIAALARRRAGGMDDSVDYFLSEAVKTLRQSRGALAAKADGPALGKVFENQLAVLKALSAGDPRLCVDFLYGGASEAFFKFSAENRTLVSDLAIAGLEAIVDGKQKNVSRVPPNEQDFQAFETALKQKGLAQSEIDALLDGKTPDPPLPDARMCAAGKIYLETLAKLPEASRLRIYSLAVDLMARS